MASQQELARAHVLKGREIVNKQRERVAELRDKGGRRGLSEELLRTFEETLRLFEEDLQRYEMEAACVLPRQDNERPSSRV